MALKYVGNGDQIKGKGRVVPPRDLTDDEEKEFLPVITENYERTGVARYEPASKTRAERINRRTRLQEQADAPDNIPEGWGAEPSQPEQVAANNDEPDGAGEEGGS